MSNDRNDDAATAYEPGDEAWKLIEPYWDSIFIYGEPATFLRGIESVPEPVRHLYSVYWCHYEIGNGGLAQFFYNSTGVLAPEAVRGFRELGLTDLAAIVQEAMQMLGPPYPRARELRWAALEAITSPGVQIDSTGAFRALEDRYDAAMPHYDVYLRMDEYARRVR